MNKTLLSVLAALLTILLLGTALGEDCFTVRVDSLNLDRLKDDGYVQAALSSDAQGIRVRKSISDNSELAANVRLIVKSASGSVVFDRDYGFQSGTFDSGAIYLPYAGDAPVMYLVTLYAGDLVYALPYRHCPKAQTMPSASDGWDDAGWVDDTASGGWADDASEGGWADDASAGGWE